jgi:hypothetical protein
LESLLARAEEDDAALGTNIPRRAAMANEEEEAEEEEEDMGKPEIITDDAIAVCLSVVCLSDCAGEEWRWCSYASSSSSSFFLLLLLLLSSFFFFFFFFFVIFSSDWFFSVPLSLYMSLHHLHTSHVHLN